MNITSKRIPNIPYSVYRQAPFKYNPKAFAVESEDLKEKIIEADTQLKSIENWVLNPNAKITYGVMGNPDEAKARYFAAFLASVHVKHLGAKAKVSWITVYGDFVKPEIEESTLIVITNVAVNSTPHKIEKTKDLIERYSDYPLIVVGSGIDPISMFATKLRCPVHALAYFPEPIVKLNREVE